MVSPNKSAGVYVREIDLSQFVSSAPSTIAAIVGESLRGPVNERTLITSTSQFLATFGRPDAGLSYLAHCALAYLSEGSQLYVTRVAPDAEYGGATVSFSNNLASAQSWSAGTQEPELVEFGPSDLFHIYAANPGAWNTELRCVVYPNTALDDNSFFIDVYVAGQSQPVESYSVTLNYVVDGNGVQRNIAEHINKRSSRIRISQNEQHAEFVAGPTRKFINTVNNVYLVGGRDARKATSADMIAGWDLYADPEVIDVTMLINGGYTAVEIQQKMVELCESRMDCVAILDFPSLEQQVQDAITYRRTEMQFDSSYAATYVPDVLVLDEYSERRLLVPPSGHVAAAYARTDNEFELWFAPAGMNRGRMDVLGARHLYNEGDRDALQPHQINPIRMIRGTGLRIWGEATMQTKSSSLSNISVRRLMIHLEKSLSRAALYSVFDPNDQILWASLTEMSNRFLQPIKDGRGVYDFKVVCDESNNTKATIAEGDVILTVLIDPTISAKRIILRAVVNKTGARVTQV